MKILTSVLLGLLTLFVSCRNAEEGRRKQAEEKKILSEYRQKIKDLNNELQAWITVSSSTVGEIHDQAENVSSKSAVLRAGLEDVDCTADTTRMIKGSLLTLIAQNSQAAEKLAMFCSLRGKAYEIQMASSEQVPGARYGLRRRTSQIPQEYYELDRRADTEGQAYSATLRLFNSTLAQVDSLLMQ